MKTNIYKTLETETASNKEQREDNKTENRLSLTHSVRNKSVSCR